MFDIITNLIYISQTQSFVQFVPKKKKIQFGTKIEKQQQTKKKDKN